MTSKMNVSQLKSIGVKDYTYAILFFIISSFFAFFVIRPVLSIAISLQKEAKELKVINQTYELNISKVLELQSDLQLIHENKYLIDKAIPQKPHLHEIINDFQRAAQDEGILIQSLNIQSISLTNLQKTNDPLKINAEINLNGNFDQVNHFVHNIAGQKRIKKVISVKISQNKESIPDNNLNLTMTIEIYYHNNEITSK